MQAKNLRKQGKWSPNEDELLVQAVQAYKKTHVGQKIVFSVVVQNVVGRSAKQAQERWENHLRPDLKRGEWSVEETISLLDLIAEHAQDWSTIAKEIPQRGFHGIKVKGRTLLREIVPKRRAARLVKLGKTTVGKRDVEWSLEDQKRLLHLHLEASERSSSDNFAPIVEELSVIRPEAELERKVLKSCQCDGCLVKKQDILAFGGDFKSAWSKFTAKKMRSQYAKNDTVAPTAPSTSPVKVTVVNIDIESAEYTQKRKHRRLAHEQLTKTIAEGSMMDIGELKKRLARRRSSSKSCDTSTDASSLGSDGDRRRLFRSESSKTIESGTTAELSLSEKEFMLDADVGEEKGAFLDVVKRFEGIPEFTDFVEGYTKYLSSMTNRLLNSSKLYGNICLSNPFLSHMLHTKFNEKHVDPWYDLDFLFPSSPEAQKFSPNKPIGAIAFQVGSCLALDADKEACKLIGSFRHRHWFDMQASPLHAFFLLGNMFPKLVKYGQVWCRQIFKKAGGGLGVYLVHVQFKYFNQGACRFRVQDISECYPHLIQHEACMLSY